MIGVQVQHLAKHGAADGGIGGGNRWRGRESSTAANSSSNQWLDDPMPDCDCGSDECGFGVRSTALQQV